MGPLAYLRSAVGIVTILIIVGLFAWGVRVDHLREGWKSRFDDLVDQSGKVLAAVRIASDNPKLKWQDTAAQVEALDASLTQWRGTARTQSDLIDTMGRDSERLRAENDALKVKVRELNQKRASLIAQLQQDALDPGDRADCWAQLRATEDALNLLYREGF